MTAQEFAERLNWREYGSELARGESELARQHGLVVAYGASDDLLEFAGAIEDEAGAFGGATVTLDVQGLRPCWDAIKDHASEAEAERFFERRRLPSTTVQAVWHDRGPRSWTIQTDIPHATFLIVEDGEPFCQGIVFRLADVGSTAAEMA
jgi:hypothetical protein